MPKAMKTRENNSISYFNSGHGVSLSILEIGLKDYVAIIEPDLAFWSLVSRDALSKADTFKNLAEEIDKKQEAFNEEIDSLRFKLTPSAVYFNPTERCNLDCTYCYLPDEMRKSGRHMSVSDLISSLSILKGYFDENLPKGVTPQLVFHGSEPLMVRDAIFEAIESFGDDFSFGIQTNATLLDKEACDFLTAHKVGIGISLDGHTAEIADKNRRTWANTGTFLKVLKAMDMLNGYPHLNAICTVTSSNVKHQSNVVRLMHDAHIPVGMLNYVRCTRKGGQEAKPENRELAGYFIQALELTYDLYKKTNRKLIIANFANILLSLTAPAARRLMCDISPCGGGRAFVAVGANGDVFPCSEFVGMPNFSGGNIFKDPLKEIIDSPAFKAVTQRRVEDIEPCRRCSIRHFCGAPCPAEIYGIHARLDMPSGYCEFFEEQVRYALRLLADNRYDAFLYDDWKRDTSLSCNITSL